ncbi:T9SS type A sorting domain-containing protein [Crocinitomix catalasitica]|uniref:T9SS type A sorting domain-containing protein n=1 Tax=Crocinitomix catalasitica TaxID=184607 RepID=UPI000486F499|nr:T9SS type A sorting domain-containing protein [Crocinitomix catalasitica]
MKILPLHKSLLFVLALIFTVQIGYTQSLEWVKSANKESVSLLSYSHTNIVEVDAEGNTYVLEKIKGTADVDLSDDIHIISSIENLTTYIVKYDPNGDLLWTKMLQDIPDGDAGAIAYDFQLIGLDRVVICGFFLDDFDFDPSDDTYILASDIDYPDGYVWCLDENGDFIWAQKYGGSDYDVIHSVTANDDDNLSITGAFTGVVDFDNGPDEVLKDAGGESYSGFILNIDPVGNFIWVKTFYQIESGWSNIIDLSINADNEYYATAYFRGTIDADPGDGIYPMTASRSSSMCIIKLDSDGNFIWAKQIDGVFPISILSDANGVYIYGFHGDIADFDPGIDEYNLYTGSGTNSFLLKLDEEGDFVWANHVGGTATITPSAMQQDSDGYIYLTGNYENGDADLDPTAGTLMVETPDDWGINTDFFIQKFNTDGELLWAHGSEAYGNETIRDIHIQGDQMLCYGECQETETNFNLEGGYASIPRADDYFLWKLNLCQDGMRDTLNLTACESYTVPSGDETYYVPGSYSDTIVYFGCEKILSINLDFYDHPGSLTFEGGLYQAHPAGERIYYKWVDCDNDFELIPGQTEQYFFPRTEGNYAAIIRVDGCPDTTECINSGPLSLVNNATSLNMRIHPNPTKGNINITVTNATNIEIYSAVGELIWQQSIQQGQSQINMNAFAKGLYFIAAKSENGAQISTQKFVLH